MRKFVLVAAGWIMAGGLPLWANGGGYTLGYNSTGAVGELVKKGRLFVPVGTSQAQIVSEDLRIELLTESADVEVRYRIRNEGGAGNVTIGFPVEYGARNMFEGSAPLVAEPLSRYEITLDGKPVKAEFVNEPQPAARNADSRREGIAGWHVSRLRFEKNAEHELQIRYRVPYFQEVWFVSNDGQRSAPTFRYRLSTGGVWKGPIEHGRVEVRSLRAENAAFVIRKPEGKFLRDGDRYVWEFAALEPTLADDIEIAVRPTVDEHGAYEFIGERYYYVIRPKTITASSTLTEGGTIYHAARVGHGANQPWAEGVEGDGIGETLTFDFEKPHRLERIEINPGHARSEKLWAANNRVARVEITLNDEHKFTADLPDEYLKVARFEIPVKGYDKPVKKAVLKILAVHRGSRDADTCISQVRFVTRLSRKPELQPSR